MQAGILEGQVSDVMVLSVWQASLMRAFAKQRLREDDQLAASAGLDPQQLDDSSDDEVSMYAVHSAGSLPAMSLTCYHKTGCGTAEAGSMRGPVVCVHACCFQTCIAQQPYVCRHQAAGGLMSFEEGCSVLRGYKNMLCRASRFAVQTTETYLFLIGGHSKVVPT